MDAVLLLNGKSGLSHFMNKRVLIYLFEKPRALLIRYNIRAANDLLSDAIQF